MELEDSVWTGFARSLYADLDARLTSEILNLNEPFGLHSNGADVDALLASMFPILACLRSQVFFFRMLFGGARALSQSLSCFAPLVQLALLQ